MNLALKSFLKELGAVESQSGQKIRLREDEKRDKWSKDYFRGGLVSKLRSKSSDGINIFKKSLT